MFIDKAEDKQTGSKPKLLNTKHANVIVTSNIFDLLLMLDSIDMS